MPRIARIVAQDFPHHVIQRGARNQRVFFSNDDKALYKVILQEELDKTRLELWAYCLMDNHVHFVAVPREAKELSQVFKETHKRYAYTINKREGWRGHLWQERFHSFVMDEPYLYAAIRYVENNPVKARIVNRAEDYPWSSAGAHIYSKPDSLLSECFVQNQIQDWRAFLLTGAEHEADTMEKHMNGNPLGSPQFIGKLESLLKIKITKKPRGRPRDRNK